MTKEDAQLTWSVSIQTSTNKFSKGTSQFVEKKQTLRIRVPRGPAHPLQSQREDVTYVMVYIKLLTIQ